MAKKWNTGLTTSRELENAALRCVGKKNVYVNGKSLDLSRASGIGNSTWGAIDYLTKYEAYRVTGQSIYNAQFTETQEDRDKRKKKNEKDKMAKTKSKKSMAY